MLIAGCTGWAAVALLCALHVRLRRRLVLVARASHELRGPLCAARLGLDTLASERGRVAAIDLELRRAARALDDLAAAPSGARAPERRELVDLDVLVASHAPAWQALAAAHAAELRLETVTEAVPAAELRLETVTEAAPAAELRLETVTEAAPAAELRLETVTEAAPATLLPVPASRSRLRPGSRHRPATLPGGAPASGPPDRRRPAPAGGAASVRRLGARGPAATPATAVYADPVRVAQACANLVANAAEHGGGVVRVRVCAAGDAVRLEVTDAGPGLPAPVAVLVASGRTRRGRRGHGLAVAAAVAEGHGGRLTAAPASAGARLVLELPAAAPALLSRLRAAAPPEIVA